MTQKVYILLKRTIFLLLLKSQCRRLLMLIAKNLDQIKKSLPKSVRLVAVTKTQPIESIFDAYRTGHRIFGENKVQELVSKYEQLPKDIEWHMIGHLQTNKVKFIAPFVHLIHGVDSMKLLTMINQEGVKANRIISCLLQVKIAKEETKYGMLESEADVLLGDKEISTFSNINIAGLMGMATYTDDTTIIRNEFRNLSTIFNKLQKKYFSTNPDFKELSMGMSHDYAIAVEEGATYIRVGSSIFGERNYT